MKPIFTKATVDKLFFWGILIKSFIGFWEILAGAFFAISGQKIVNALGLYLAKQGTADDSDDFLLMYLQKITNDFTHNIQLFAAFYLMFHGLMNILLSVTLAKKKIAWYPAIISLLSLFVVYEAYRFFLNHSIIILGLIIFDIAFITIIVLEYRKGKKHE